MRLVAPMPEQIDTPLLRSAVGMTHVLDVIRKDHGQMLIESAQNSLFWHGYNKSQILGP